MMFVLGLICGGIGTTLILFLICSLLIGGNKNDR